MVIMQFTKTVLKNLFSKPVTTKYPFVKKEYPKATRGKVAIDINSCIFCGICARKCPTGAILVNKESKEWKIERFDCINCSYCVECCPKKCLMMDNEYTSPNDVKYVDSFKLESSPAEQGGE